MNTNILFAIFLFVTLNNQNVTGSYNNDIYNAIDLTTYLPNNYAKDGSIDYTEYIQRGLDDCRYSIMPNFPVLINESGLKLKSNSHIYFPDQSVLITKPSSLGFYATLWVLSVENIVIDNISIVGDRENHMSEKGEWGMGIYIDKSENIVINNPEIYNCWGDGIYIGGGSSPSKNITINSAKIDNNRRNGITITNGEFIFINNSYISNSNGVPPMAGLCIEPNNKNNNIDHIYIDNITTYKNSNYGIVINLNKILTNNGKNVNIAINNHSDNSSKTGLSIVDLFDQKRRIKGKISILNPKWNNNIIPSRIGKFKNGPDLNLRNIKVQVNDIVDYRKTINTMNLYRKNGNIVE